MEIKIPTRYSKMGVKELLPIAQKWVNKYVRLRDSQNGYFKCISCGQINPTSELNAGHYLPTTYGPTRLNPINIWGQCIQCNFHKHGNQEAYRANLIKKIGLAEVEKLEITARMRHKFDRLTLILTIQEFQQKCKELE